jgi:ribosomal protein S27AE
MATKLKATVGDGEVVVDIYLAGTPMKTCRNCGGVFVHSALPQEVDGERGLPRKVCPTCGGHSFQMPREVFCCPAGCREDADA